MQATLYLPQQPPQAVPVDNFRQLDLSTRFAAVPLEVSVLMNCAPELVDVLASGSDYVAYSVLDCEGLVNQTAMTAVAKVSGVTFDAQDEDTVLRGPVLVISAA
jgi:hypothetical protein